MRRPEIMEPPTRGYTAYRDMLEECLKDAQDMDRVRFTDPPPPPERPPVPRRAQTPHASPGRGQSEERNRESDLSGGSGGSDGEDDYYLFTPRTPNRGREDSVRNRDLVRPRAEPLDYMTGSARRDGSAESRGSRASQQGGADRGSIRSPYTGSVTSAPSGTSVTPPVSLKKDLKLLKEMIPRYKDREDKKMYALTVLEQCHALGIDTSSGSVFCNKEMRTRMRGKLEDAVDNLGMRKTGRQQAKERQSR